MNTRIPLSELLDMGFEPISALARAEFENLGSETVELHVGRNQNQWARIFLNRGAEASAPDAAMVIFEGTDDRSFGEATIHIADGVSHEDLGRLVLAVDELLPCLRSVEPLLSACAQRGVKRHHQFDFANATEGSSFLSELQQSVQLENRRLRATADVVAESMAAIVRECRHERSSALSRAFVGNAYPVVFSARELVSDEVGPHSATAQSIADATEGADITVLLVPDTLGTYRVAGVAPAGGDESNLMWSLYHAGRAQFYTDRLTEALSACAEASSGAPRNIGANHESFARFDEFVAEGSKASGALGDSSNLASKAGRSIERQLKHSLEIAFGGCEGAPLPITGPKRHVHAL